MKSLANEFFKTMAEGARKHQGEHSSEYELIVNALPPLKVVQLLGNHRRCASGKLGQAVVPGLAASAVPRRRIA
jgi:ribose transport system substrate-binding protein